MNDKYFGPNAVCNESEITSVKTCRYRAYRVDAGSENEYGFDIEWFRITSVRLLFVVIFEVHMYLLIL